MSRLWDMEKLILCVKLTKGQSMSQKVNVLLILGWVSAMKPAVASHSMTISCVSISWHQQPGKYTLLLGGRGWTYILIWTSWIQTQFQCGQTYKLFNERKRHTINNCDLCNKCSPRGVDKLLWNPVREIGTLYRRDFKNRKCDIWARLKEAWEFAWWRKAKDILGRGDYRHKNMDQKDTANLGNSNKSGGMWQVENKAEESFVLIFFST